MYNIGAFHFHLTNIILLLMNGHREGEFYFCGKEKEDVHFVKCTMIFLEIKKGKEHLERFQHNHNELKKITDKMWPYLKKKFRSLVLWIYLLRNITGLHETETTAHTVILQEIIDNMNT